MDTTYTDTLRGLLNSPAWMRTRGVTAGDRPNETLADSIRRELTAAAAPSYGETGDVELDGAAL